MTQRVRSVLERGTDMILVLLAILAQMRRWICEVSKGLAVAAMNGSREKKPSIGRPLRDQNWMPAAERGASPSYRMQDMKSDQEPKLKEEGRQQRCRELNC